MLVVAKILFWLLFLLAAYTYIFYGLLLYLLVFFKNKLNNKHNTCESNQENDFLPSITLVIAAYNEADCIVPKIDNTLQLDYPPEKRQIFIVTDGSTDQTPQLVAAHQAVKHFHTPERKGKIAAVHRIMTYIDTPITVFTDANTMLNPLALKNMVRHYQRPDVGAVAGEKRIAVKGKDAANAAGEGFYWKYEAKLKQWDSDLYSVVGAAGELFSIRTALYEAVPHDTIIEDFYMTLRIAQKGHRVVYEPDAFAVEGPSASVAEELKRKIRIAAGGLQAISRLLPLLNIFRYGLLSFQYISHRVLRWTVTPLALPVLFVLNAYLAFVHHLPFYQGLFVAQLVFYGMALMGYLLEKKHIKVKILFIPYYFCIMNYAVYKGMWRILTGRQSVVWEKAKRA